MKRGNLGVVLLLLALLVPALAASAQPPARFKEVVHKFTHSQVFSGDICGDRSGVDTFTVTSRFMATAFEDGTVNVVYGETGSYTTDFDAPNIEDHTSQFTGAGHLRLTRGGTLTFTEQFHDFPGTIQIHTQVVVVEVDGQLKVDRELLSVTGCP